MKVNLKKLLVFGFLLSILVVLFTPLYLYFSRDVSVLKASYPHRLKDGAIEIRPQRPVDWVSLKEISPFARGAIVISEDWAFWHHEGIDLEQLRIALEEAVDGKKMRGASTITQQMVKNVLLTSERSFWRKFHELILAQRVEKELTKERILEIYLNSIEFGPDVYGIKKAASHYFKKHPSMLSPREGAFLAMLLPSPVRYYKSFRQMELTPFARERIHTILTKMRMGKIISKERFEEEVSSRFQWER